MTFRGYEAYVVLTVCRSHYTLKFGRVTSKPAASRWAQTALDERWAGLIERALIGRQKPQNAGPVPEEIQGKHLSR